MMCLALIWCGKQRIICHATYTQEPLRAVPPPPSLSPPSCWRWGDAICPAARLTCITWSLGCRGGLNPNLCLSALRWRRADNSVQASGGSRPVEGEGSQVGGTQRSIDEGIGAQGTRGVGGGLHRWFSKAGEGSMQAGWPVFTSLIILSVSCSFIILILCR